MADTLVPTFTRGETILDVPVNGESSQFVFPAEMGKYSVSMGRVTERNLTPARGEELAHLLHVAYIQAPNELGSAEVKKIMGERWMWVPNRNLWTPEGVYVCHDPRGIGTSEPLDHDELEKRLKGSTEIDGIRFGIGVNFAQRKTFREGEYFLSSEEFAEDGFIRASYGIEGARKLAEVAKKFFYSPRVKTINVENGSEQRLSMLSGYADRLGASGDGFGGDIGCYSLGVRVVV